MDKSRFTSAAIYSHFERTLMTDDQPVAQEYYEGIKALLPGIDGPDDILTENEVFLFAAMLANVR